MCNCCSINQLRIDPQIITTTTNAPFEDIPDTQILDDLGRLHGLPFVSEGRIAGNDEHIGYPGELGSKILCYTVRNISLLLVVTQIVKRQHDDGRFSAGSQLMRRKWIGAQPMPTGKTSKTH